MHTISIKSMYLFLLANQLHIIFTIGTMNDVIIWGNHLFEHLFYKRSSDFISTAIKSLCNVCTIKCWNVKLYIDYDVCRYTPEANQFHTNMYIATVRATFIILQVSSTAYSSWSTLYLLLIKYIVMKGKKLPMTKQNTVVLLRFYCTKMGSWVYIQTYSVKINIKICINAKTSCDKSVYQFVIATGPDEPQ